MAPKKARGLFPIFTVPLFLGWKKFGISLLITWILFSEKFNKPSTLIKSDLTSKISISLDFSIQFLLDICPYLTPETHSYCWPGWSPKIKYTDEINEGEIGFFTAGIRHVSDCKVGDTITDETNPTDKSLPGFKPSIPVVFCGLYPIDLMDYEPQYFHH